MRALILCAGLGTRLRPLTDKTPKPMVKVGGKPILEHIADHLNIHGIKDIVVNLYWQPAVITKYFGSRFRYFPEHELLGTGGTLREVAKKYSGDWVVMNGDTLTKINISGMVEDFYKYGLDGLVHIDWSHNKINHCGTMVFSQKAIEKIPENRFYRKLVMIEKHFIPKVKNLVTYYEDCYRQNISTLEDLKKARKQYANRSDRLPKLRK